jgi:hypothetical protein
LLLWINNVTIAYSTFSESAAQIYGFLSRGVNDSLIGTVVAITASAAVIYLLSRGGTTRFQNQKASSTRVGNVRDF